MCKKFQETQVLSSYFRPWCDGYTSVFFWIFFTQEGRICHRSRKDYFSYFRLGYKSGPVLHNVHLIFIDSIMLIYLKIALQWILFLVFYSTIQTKWILVNKAHAETLSQWTGGWEKASAPSVVYHLVMYFVLSCFWTCLGDLLSKDTLLWGNVITRLLFMLQWCLRLQWYFSLLLRMVFLLYWITEVWVHIT